MRTRTYHVQLTSEAGPTATLDIATWGAVYNLALDYGWRPMGTEPPIGWQPPTYESGWSRAYAMPAGQTVGPLSSGRYSRTMSHPVHQLRDLLPDRWRPRARDAHGLILQR